MPSSGSFAASPLVLCLALGCHASTVADRESEESGCPRASIEVVEACEEGYYRADNGCDHMARHYRCEVDLPFSPSRCRRATPSCALPPRTAVSGAP